MRFYRKKRLPDLETLLRYRNPKVIATFRREHLVSESDAEDLFCDLLRWLWLCRAHDQDLCERPVSTPQTLSIFTPMKRIDQMWHAFILCTRDYSEFCEKYLGGFIHHEPEISTDPATHETPTEAPEQELRTTLQYTCTRLGQQTMLRWFAP